MSSTANPLPLPRLVLRADGNAHIGLGHVMRLLALADMLQAGFTTSVFASKDAAALAPLLATAGLSVVAIPALSLPAEAAWLQLHLLQPTDVLVLDGYDFGFEYQEQLRASVGRLVYIDDLRAWPVVADVLINHSPGIEPAMYQLAESTASLLLGPAYSLLRPAFLAAAAPPSSSHSISKILICFGGADPLHLTQRCLQLLITQPALQEIGILVGQANPDSLVLQQLIEAQPPGRTVWYANAKADRMVALLHHYDAIVCPASTILIESLLVGKAALTGYYADNQQHLADFVHTHQQAYSIGNFAALTDEMLLHQLLTGLDFLAQHPRQPYTTHLCISEMRAVVAAPLPSGGD